MANPIYDDAVYTESQLNQLCDMFQKTLRIQDWVLNVQVVHESEIDGADGQHNSDLGQMRSLIRLASPESRKPASASPNYSMRETLLHELVHIVFSTLAPNSAEENGDEVRHCLFESGIDRIACALDSLIPDYVFCPRCDRMTLKDTEVPTCEVCELDETS